MCGPVPAGSLVAAEREDVVFVFHRHWPGLPAWPNPSPNSNLNPLAFLVPYSWQAMRGTASYFRIQASLVRPQPAGGLSVSWDKGYSAFGISEVDSGKTVYV
jgi:hypothetical protein